MEKEKKDYSKPDSSCDCEKEWEQRIEKKVKDWEKCGKTHKSSHAFIGGGFYCFGVIASAVYYIQQVDGFWLTILAILKALVWPVFLIYKVFQLLSM